MTYLIPGRPYPLQRARYNPHSKRPWDPQKALKLQIGNIISQQNKLKIFYDGPLKLEIRFYFPRTRSTRNDVWHDSRPDTTNLIKLIEDVAQGILFKDDCTICWIDARKMYDDQPRVEFSLYELNSRSITDGK
jgi:Holliday junction resolvase RusA-like endonuclease